MSRTVRSCRRFRATAPLLGSALGAIGLSSLVAVPHRASADSAADTWVLTCLHGTDPSSRIAVAPDGTLYVCGRAFEPVLPASLNAPVPADRSNVAFVAAIGGDGAVRWSRYLLGRAPGPIRIGADGSVWCVGRSGANSDIGLTKLAPDGALVFETVFGGSGAEVPSDLAITADGDAIVVGATESQDFPVAGAFQPIHGGGTGDGFVARIRGDGSGVAWASYVGGEDYDDVTAVAVDSGGAIVAAGRSRPHTSYTYLHDVNRRMSLSGLAVMRISADGALLGSANPFGVSNYGGVFSIAASSDGSVILAGSVGCGFVARLDPVALRIVALRRDDAFSWNRMAVTSAGDVLVAAMDGDDSSGPDGPGGPAAVVRLAPDLTVRPARVGLAAIGQIADLAVAGGDGLWLAGSANGLAFRDGEPDVADGAACIEKIPTSGLAPPSKVRVLRQREHSVDLAWPADGDPMVAYEVERVRHPDTFDTTYSAVRRLPRSKRHVHIGGLAAMGTFGYRLVSVFASGLRSATAVSTAHTHPLPVTRLRAALGPNRVVSIDWDDVRWGGIESTYFVQKKTGDGPYVPCYPLGESPYFHGIERYVTDFLPGCGVAVRYRVCASAHGVHSRWAYSPLVQGPDASLRVSQERGRIRVEPRGDGRVAIDMRGTIAVGDENGASIDLTRDDFELLFGDTGRPIRLFAPRGSDRWVRFGSIVWLCSYPNDDITSVVEFVYDERSGSFRAWASLEQSYIVPIFHPQVSTPIEVGIAIGGLAGGDLRDWQPVGAPERGLELR